MQEDFEKLTVLINRINRNIRKMKSRKITEYDLRGVHISCLQYLYKHDGAIASNLCEGCKEDKATISRALNYLEANGFIYRQSENSKRYKSSVLLTAKGRYAGEKITEMNSGVLNGISSNFTKNEITTLFDSLSNLNDYLEVNFNISE